MSPRGALLIALLAITTQATLLPSLSVRQVDARDFTGTFSSLFKSTLCPQKIKHSGLVDGGNAVAHANIELDGKKCDNNGNMNLIPVSQTGRVNDVISKLPDPSKALAQNLYDKAKDINGSYVGTSGATRKCENMSLAANTFFVFVKSDKDFDTGVPGVPPYGANRRVMAFVEPPKNFLCPYDAKLRESPSPVPTPVAAPPGASISPKPGASKGVEPIPDASPMAEATPGAGDSGGSGSSGGDSPSSSPPSGGSICFPAVAQVELADGTHKPMSEVVIGDVVRVEGNKYSPVFMFTHKLNDVSNKFTRLVTVTGTAITLTSGHYLRVNGAMRPASTVAVGDTLTLASGAAAAVRMVQTVDATGLYNPQTIDGSIVVDGVVASTYTTAVEMRTAHSLLAPLRTVYNALGLSTTALESGADRVASLLPDGAAAY